MKKIALFLSVIFSALLSVNVFAYEYVVTNTNNDGSGSLRQAVQDANNNQNPGNGSPATPHRIVFNISSAPGADGKYVITLNNSLDFWSSSLIEIDATTQSGSACGTPVIVLRGNGGGNCFNGSNINLNVSGFIIQNWSRAFNFNNARGSIKSCWIGLNNTGTAGAGSVAIREHAIFLSGNNSSNFVIGGPGCDRNVIANTLQYTSAPGGEVGAIHIDGLGANGSSIVIENNYLGTDTSGNVRVANGSGYPLREVGVYIRSSNRVTIKDNVISGTTGNGIWNSQSNSTLITGNIIGLGADGITIIGNGGAGIRADESTGLIIGGSSPAERNVISANGGAPDSRNCGAAQWSSGTGGGQPCAQSPCEAQCPDKYDGTLQTGIYFKSVSSSFIRGNYVGTDATGNSTGTNNATGNMYAGIKFEDASTGNTIGGPDATYRNIIGGNGFDDDAGRTAMGESYLYKGHGVQLNKASVRGTVVENNYIGIGADGVSAVGNRQDGVSLLGAGDNTIRNNVISDNAFGIFMQSDFQSGVTSGQPLGNVVVGNYIGTAADGKTAVGNGTRAGDDDGAGIGIQHGSNKNRIGGTTEAERNIIAGNLNGIVFRYEAGNSQNPPNENAVFGNYVGVDIDKDSLPNTREGIMISNGAFNNIIGGPLPGQSNIIANNGANGINIADEGSNRNSITRNSIYCNGLRGIELNGIGNAAYPAPLIHSNSTDEVLRGEAPANAYIEIFRIDDCNGECLPGNGKLQGKEFVGSVMSDANGFWSFTQPNPTDYKLFTATASDVRSAPIAAAHYNTSEFSTCILVCTPVASVTLEADTYEICSLEEAPEFKAVATGGEPHPLSFEWYKVENGVSSLVLNDVKTLPEDTTSLYTPDEEGEYMVLVYTQIRECSTASVSRILVLNEIPDFSLSPDTDTDICIGEQINLLVTVNNQEAGNYQYDWSVTPGGQPVPAGESGVVSPTDTTEYTVVVTSPKGCKDTSAVVTINVNTLPDPAITVDGPLVFCEGADSVTLKAVKDGAYTYQWKNGAILIPGPDGVADSLIVKESGSYMVIVANSATNCIDSTSASIDVTVNENPALSISPEGEMQTCIGSEVSIVATGSGTLEWFVDDVLDPAETSFTYTATASATYKATLTDGNGCSSSDTVSITFSTDKVAIVAAATPDFCEDDSARIAVTTQLVSGVQWFYNDVEIVGATELIYYAKQPGDYKAYVETSTGCKDTSDAVSVIMNDNPVVASLTVSTTELCADDTVTVSVTASAGTGPYEYSWSPVEVGVDETSFSHVPSDTTTYSIVVTDANGCSSDEGTVTVNVKDRPVASPVSAAANGVCFGDSTELNAQASGGSGTGYTYSWIPAETLSDPNLANPIAKPSVETTYRVVVTDDASCSSDTAGVTVVVNANPTVSIGSAEPICEEESISFTTTASSEDLQYAWTGNGLASTTEANPTATPDTDGTFTYTLVVTDALGCSSDEQSVIVVVHPKPDVPGLMTDEDVICFGETTEIRFITNYVGYNINWYKDGELLSHILPDLEVSESGKYTAVIEHETTLCRSDESAEIDIEVKPEPVDLILSGGPNVICDGTSATFSTNYANAPEYIVDWYKDGGLNSIHTGNSFSTGDSGVYTAVVTIRYEDGKECPFEAEETVEVKVNPTPVVDISTSPNGAICVGEDITLKARVIRTSFDEDWEFTYPDHISYDFTWNGFVRANEWDVVGSGDTITVDANYIRYGVTVTDMSRETLCSRTVWTNDLNLVSLIARIDEDTLDICLNSDRILFAFDSSGTNNHAFVWSDTAALKYTSVREYPSSGFVHLNVSGIATAPNDTVGEEWLFLTVRDNQYTECAVSDSVLLRVHPLPVVSIVTSLDTMCVNTPITLTASADKGTPYEDKDREYPYNLYWGYKDTTYSPYVIEQIAAGDTMKTSIEVRPHIAPKQTYVVMAVDSMRCEAIDSVTVYPTPNQDLVIPNLITPNGDNRNETLVIEDRNTGTDIFPGAKLEIYNRWGQAVYRSNNYENDWGGQGCAEGVYYYILKTGCGDDDYKGWVQIVSNNN